MKRLAILGSTGSIGQSTLSIVEQFPERYAVAALAAGRNVDEAFAQAVRWRPRMVSLATEELAGELAARLAQGGRFRDRGGSRDRRHDCLLDIA